MEGDSLAQVIFELTVQGCGFCQCRVIGGMVVTVENREYLVKGASKNTPLTITFAKQVLGVFDHLDRLRAKGAWPHLDIGRGQAILMTNFFEVVRFGFPALTNDKQTLVRGSLCRAAFKVTRLLAVFGLVVLSHAVCLDLSS
jgi:hypothetical protein